jgi:hypothetical protein
MLASDPAGALLVYPSGQGKPARVPLLEGKTSTTPVEPVGLSRTLHGDIAVTDAHGGRILVLPASSLLR